MTDSIECLRKIQRNVYDILIGSQEVSEYLKESDYSCCSGASWAESKLIGKLEGWGRCRQKVLGTGIDGQRIAPLQSVLVYNYFFNVCYFAK